VAAPVTPRTGTAPVTLLRAGAAVLGAYGYVLGLLLARHDLNPEPVATIRAWLNRPLGLGEDFGPFAVMLLLAAAGLQPRRLVQAGLSVLATVCVCLFLYEDPARLLAFLPLLLVGYVTWAVVDGRLPALTGVPLGVGCLAVVVAADRGFPGLQPWWYPVTAAFAALLLLVAVRPGPTAAAVAGHPVTRGLAFAAEVPFFAGAVLVLVGA
jgi:hypothetical protein